MIIRLNSEQVILLAMVKCQGHTWQGGEWSVGENVDGVIIASCFIPYMQEMHCSRAAVLTVCVFAARAFYRSTCL